MIDFQKVELIGYLLAIGGLWVGVILAIRLSNQTPQDQGSSRSETR